MITLDAEFEFRNVFPLLAAIRHQYKEISDFIDIGPFALMKFDPLLRGVFMGVRLHFRPNFDFK